MTRRTFLTASGLAGAGALGLDLIPTKTYARGKAGPVQQGKHRITTTICPYCAVGCGLLVTSEHKNGGYTVINVEGDPDHPINEGRLCPKGASLYQLANNKNRLRKVLYRAPGALQFEEKEWRWAAREIAKRIKATRDATFTLENAAGKVVNRTTAIASVGSAALDNEECWLYQKFLRALGLVYMEHQARICHSSTVAALAATFGCGAMSNHWIDLGNSDCILMMGCNPAECHPVSLRWIHKAKQNGATVISVDPRYTHSSAIADIYAPLRAGTDIAFLGGMIKYILDKDLIHRDYVVNYTNAACLIDNAYNFDPATGLFSGYDDEQHKYDKESWQYQTGAGGEPLQAPDLRHPRCVYQLLKEHYRRYDLETVAGVTGTPPDTLKQVYEAYTKTGAADQAGTIMYAMGWTQHTVGTQLIRTMAVIQLLLGNMGCAGGGVNALRGESNVQGSTDHALLFDILPGYLRAPHASQQTLAAYHQAYTPKRLGKLSANWWDNYPKYSVSFLKSLYGVAAARENDFAYSWLPKIDDGVDYSWLTLFDEMYQGNIKGFFVWGQNPTCSGANANKVRRALTTLDWLVNVNVFPSETGWFWQDKNLGMDPAKIRTEVFVLPAAASIEKEGSITNSGRWMQWRYQASDAPGEAKPDAEIMHMIYRELKALYTTEGGAFPEPIINLKWDYFDGDKIDPHAIAKEVNGYFLEDADFPEQGKRFSKGERVPGFQYLRDDGTTSSGNWLYCGSYPEEGNLAARRIRETHGIGLHPQWSWAWPANRRILYNRASVNLDGQPYNKEVPVIRWEGGKWTGDVPDGGWPPMHVDPEQTRYPFIMKPEGVARVFAMELEDGPLPEHYEPLESPLTANPLNGRMLSPVVKEWQGVSDAHAKPGSVDYPYVCTTFRLAEHWQTGVMTRHAPWLLELQPQIFIEIGKDLADRKGIVLGDQVRVSSKRGTVTAFALPTSRLQPLLVNGQKIQQVGLPWCFGWLMPEGGSGGDSANLLTPNIGDANTMIPETKVFMVNIEKLDVDKHPGLALLR